MKKRVTICIKCMNQLNKKTLFMANCRSSFTLNVDSCESMFQMILYLIPS